MTSILACITPWLLEEVINSDILIQRLLSFSKLAVITRDYCANIKNLGTNEKHDFSGKTSNLSTRVFSIWCSSVYTVFDISGEDVSFCWKCAELPTDLFTFTIELIFCVRFCMSYILQISSTQLGMLDIKKLGLLRNNFTHFLDRYTVCD